VCAKNHPDRLSRLATIHQRYRRTDGRISYGIGLDLTVGQKVNTILSAYKMRPPVDLASGHCCCKPSTTVVSPPVLSTVVNRLPHSEPVHNCRPLCVDNAKVEQEAGTATFLFDVHVSWGEGFTIRISDS